MALGVFFMPLVSFVIWRSGGLKSSLTSVKYSCGVLPHPSCVSSMGREMDSLLLLEFYRKSRALKDVGSSHVFPFVAYPLLLETDDFDMLRIDGLAHRQHFIHQYYWYYRYIRTLLFIGIKVRIISDVHKLEGC
jgi:hypothetical protein